MSEPRTFESAARERLDKQIAQTLDISREQAKQWILAGAVRIGDASAPIRHPSHRIDAGTVIHVAPPDALPAAPLSEPELSEPVKILYEDDWLYALSKPPGLTVHPGAGVKSATLVDVLARMGLKLAPGDVAPGLVHRLDRDTGGLILVAKDGTVKNALMKLFKDRRIEKEYRAVVEGKFPKERVRLEGRLDRDPRRREKFTVLASGREAVTEVEGLVWSGNRTLVRVFPKTGRTHQIRVHLSAAGFPVTADPLYGRPSRSKSLPMMLHAHRLSFIHPKTGKKLALTAPYTGVFKDALVELGFRAGD